MLLKLSKYIRHQADEEAFRASEDSVRQRSIEMTFMAKSLNATNAEDSVVISRSKNIAVLQIPEGEQDTSIGPHEFPVHSTQWNDIQGESLLAWSRSFVLY